MVKYFIVWKDLGSSLIYANCMIFYFVHFFKGMIEFE